MISSVFSVLKGGIAEKSQGDLHFYGQKCKRIINDEEEKDENPINKKK
ncbi:hypothetical protein M3223_11965 [Paenibacillus pasadenensis]|nr:hypothetical protein [Paenibacillus pasadenensis]